MMKKERGGATQGIDRTTLRLAIFALCIMVAFVALFSRLWYLQVLAAPDYRRLAKENRVRFVKSEPLRGRIVDRNGVVLVENRTATAVTIDRQIVDTPRETRIVLRRLARVLGEKRWLLRQRLKSELVSPYKPVPVAENVPVKARDHILENQEDFFGAVDIDKIPSRRYPKGHSAPHILGYVGEISEQMLKEPRFSDARPSYEPGDIVGRAGLEYEYDNFIRGVPALSKMIVNSTGEVLSEIEVREESAGNDLVLYLDYGIQELAEEALKAGVFANRGRYPTPAGGVVVMDPNTGGILGMASFPDYDPRILADGLTQKEYNKLGAKTKGNPDDDAFLFRPIQAQRAPASTFKIVTAGAAMAADVASPSTVLDCPGAKPYPPPGRTDVGSAEIFNNWTDFDFGLMGFPESLEVSCDTFYYELGWRLEDSSGASVFGEPNRGEEHFQRYARLTGMGHDTGIDLPNELSGRLPDWDWCREIWRATKDDKIPTCGTKDGPVWYPGETINMSIGQGALTTTPLQMAVATSAIANGGAVMQPRVAMQVGRPDEDDVEHPVRTFEPHEVARLPLDETELSVIRQGMVDVVAGSQGTARTAFSGFPVSTFPIAGKTGTSELGDVGPTANLQDAWFVSYAPADDPQYVVVVYLEKSGHGGESAAPIAREIYEGLFGIDSSLDVRLGQDASG
ncbi:MAG: penicillin-binding protein 2 [Actinobacteria bacterium]|nr:penicillin-binding protein 2 [Actinomycetota bacterium]